MAWRTEKNNQSIDIVIDGFEKGIADNPYDGIADMRNINLLSIPKEAAVGFATSAITLPPAVNAIAFTCTDATNIITVASTTGYYAGMAIIINTVSGGTGLSATSGQNTYYIDNITATTFKVYNDLTASVLVDITANGTGTLSTAQFGTPVDSVRGYGTTLSFTSGQPVQQIYILDNAGLVWALGNHYGGSTVDTVLQFCGNTNHTTLTNTASVGITIFKDYLLVFLQDKIDYINLSTKLSSTPGPNGNWHIAWQTTTTSSAGHKAIAATDDAVYFCNATTIGSILENAGSTFDPNTASTYTYNASALQLPTYDYAKSIAQLGTNLLIGGILNYVYPWDRISTSFNYPLIVAEPYIKNIVSTNANAYIFAGNRGRIYITNGANVQMFKKFPDQLSGTDNPYYAWGDAVYLRNQLYFGISATTNAAATISNFAGVWAIDLDNEYLYLSNSLSYGTYAGTVPVLVPMSLPNPNGNGLFIGWLNSTGGIDVGSTSPYTNYEAYIDTDMIPVGTYYQPMTDQQIEYKLAKPLVSGESVRIAWRGNLYVSFTTVFTDSTVGGISGVGQVNFQKQQWVQLRISLSSTASTPSYTRLREVRMR